MSRRLRIRTRLLVWLFIAGVVPLGVASFYSLRLVRSRVEDNLVRETDRSLRIGLNLLLTWVERISDDAERLGRDPLLRGLLESYGSSDSAGRARLRRRVELVLARYRHRLAFGEVVLVDRKDRLISREVLGRGGRAPPSGSSKVPVAPLPKGKRNRYLHTVDIVPGARHPVIRAMAPVIDDQFEVLGTVFVLVPMDHRFADVIRATLGVHVGFYRGRKPSASSFRDEGGGVRSGLKLSGDLLDRVGSGKGRVGVASYRSTHYSVGAIPLVSAVGRPVGIFYVALDRKALEAGKQRSYRSLLLFGAGVFLLAFLIASYASRDLSRPLTKLHKRAMAVGQGELEGRIGLEPGDEFGDLGKAFDDMTQSLRENQRRLAARISEIVTLQSIGRAVSSATGLEPVLRTVVEEVRGALQASSMSILLADLSGRIVYGVRVRDDDPADGEQAESEEGAKGPGSTGGLVEGSGSGLLTGARAIAQAVLRDGSALCVDEIQDHPELGELASQEGLQGSLMVVPLELRGQRLGVMMLNRVSSPFVESELRLLSTLADQAATAIDNARLREEVAALGDRLELLVAERTAELTQANSELEERLRELEDAQERVVLQERLSGTGQILAGVAHQISTPASVIAGAVDNLDGALDRLLLRWRQLATLGLGEDRWAACMDELDQRATGEPLSPKEARALSEDLAIRLSEQGVANARRVAHALVDTGAHHSAARLLELANPGEAEPLVGCLGELVLLRRTGRAITNAASNVRRLVDALRSYTHLDETLAERVDIHQGLDATLTVLESRLGHSVEVHRHFGDLPKVPAYRAELTQVWTHLILNAAEAMADAGVDGGELIIETELDGEWLAVHIVDQGPGIAEHLRQRIFKPFFTTRQGAVGLGLGIARRIVEKHGGRIDLASRPGATRFTVRLPVQGPPARSVSSPKSHAQSTTAPG